MNTQIDWAAMPHGDFTEALRAGLEERDNRVRQLYELTGAAPPAMAPERRGPGRPPGARPSTRAEQLAAAESGEAVQ